MPPTRDILKTSFKNQSFSKLNATTTINTINYSKYYVNSGIYKTKCNDFESYYISQTINHQSKTL